MEEIYQTTGDPNGVVVAVRPALAYSENGSVWIKTGAGENSSGWTLIIGDGT